MRKCTEINKNYFACYVCGKRKLSYKEKWVSICNKYLCSTCVEKYKIKAKDKAEGLSLREMQEQIKNKEM